MHQYKILATKYNELGALTNETEVFYYDLPEMAQTKYEQLDKQYNEYPQEDGTMKKFKAYKVEVYVSAYKKLLDPKEFFLQFVA